MICYPGVYGEWLYERYIDEYPFPKREWRKTADEFSLTHVLVHKVTAERGKSILGWAYNFDGLRIAAEDDNYILHELRATPA